MSEFEAGKVTNRHGDSTHAPGTHHHHVHPHPHVDPKAAPDTAVIEADPSKRNIVRRGNGVRSRPSRRDRSVDDGSTYSDGAALDENDPNYDSEDDRDGRRYGESPALEGGDLITLTEYKKAVKPWIEAYFINADVDEVRASLLELGATRYAYEFVKRAVHMSMDRADKEREMVSRLLSELFPDVLSRSAIGKGLERLLEGIDELEKDAPAARHVTACFIARCVVDEVLPPAFLTDAVVASLGGDVIEHAKRLLSMEHHGARLEHVWGPGDGRPASEMKAGVDQLLLEYLLSGDAEEAAKCVRQINAPHFHAEVVKRAVILGLNKTETEASSLHALLAHLVRNEVISTAQVQRGFRLVKARLSDICLDVPRAPAVLAAWVERARSDGLVDGDL